MRKLAPLLIILGFILLSSAPFAHAATPSDWPSLNADAAQSNNNPAESVLSSKNVLTLKVLWTAPIADQSYPIVAGNRVYVPVASKSTVHARALDLATGKTVATYAKDSTGGLLIHGGLLYLAGRTIQIVDPTTGEVKTHVAASPAVKGNIFVNPVGDRNVVVAGYAGAASTIPTSLYAVDPVTDTIVHRLPSTSGAGTITGNRILTESTANSVFYDETSGKTLTSPPYVGSGWFAGKRLAYTVASVKGKKVGIYAFDRTGKKVWSRTVGPALATQGTDWPHAVGKVGLFVHTLLPGDGVEGLDPLTGAVLWSQRIPFVQRMALANNVLYVLTYALNQPVRVVCITATTGKVLGAIVLSPDYYAFGAQNELMVAEGMVFIRAEGLRGSVLIALGLPQS